MGLINTHGNLILLVQCVLFQLLTVLSFYYENSLYRMSLWCCISWR